MTIAPQSVVSSVQPLAASPAGQSAAAAGPRAVADNRRSRPHLRELCDEVLASFRAARERDVLSDGDRQAAQSLLPTLTPSLRR